MEYRILNLTQHPKTSDQPVLEPHPESKKEIQELLTFNFPPTLEEMQQRAQRLAEIVLEHRCHAAMIGGAPFFMSTLERVLHKNRVRPLYSFTKRVAEEQVNPDGKVVKVSAFRHEAFIIVDPRGT